VGTISSSWIPLFRRYLFSLRSSLWLRSHSLAENSRFAVLARRAMHGEAWGSHSSKHMPPSLTCCYALVCPGAGTCGYPEQRAFWQPAPNPPVSHPSINPAWKITPPHTWPFSTSLTGLARSDALSLLVVIQKRKEFEKLLCQAFLPLGILSHFRCGGMHITGTQ
jgi:hypothetical protein